MNTSSKQDDKIENPLIQQVRYLDKLVDELAMGREMKKILRHEF